MLSRTDFSNYSPPPHLPLTVMQFVDANYVHCTQSPSPFCDECATFCDECATFHGECTTLHESHIFKLIMEEGHVQIMYPHLARRRHRHRPVAPPRSRPAQSPYGHGLDGTNAPPIVITRPVAYRQQPALAGVSGCRSADQTLRDSDAVLLARLAESRENQGKKVLKRKAAADADDDQDIATKRVKAA
ncbi:hypothetical protein B0H11DRAFT_2265152 [Mycena galericulata]|nr:hypothetical protein B0H11DRAFT_2265152 [Mycena galericulata]